MVGQGHYLRAKDINEELLRLIISDWWHDRKLHAVKGGQVALFTKVRLFDYLEMAERRLDSTTKAWLKDYFDKTKATYKTVAKKHGTTPYRVKQAVTQYKQILRNFLAQI